MPRNYPSYSPWGRIQSRETLYPGIVTVSTESHGGIIVSPEAVSVLSPEAQSRGKHYHQYLCYEEDCDASIVLWELLDMTPSRAPSWIKDMNHYRSILERSLKQWNPEYLAMREKRSKPNKASMKRQKNMCR